MAGERPRERALARAVRPHDGVDFAGVDAQIDPAKDLLAFSSYLQILDFKHLIVFFCLLAGPTPRAQGPTPMAAALASLAPLISSRLLLSGTVIRPSPRD